eukprot:jgi/Tetstr1/459474/TSEL_004841.t1
MFIARSVTHGGLAQWSAESGGQGTHEPEVPLSGYLSHRVGACPRRRATPRTPQARDQTNEPASPNLRLEEASDLDVWQEKPVWCQPWTILLTGATIVSGSFLVFHSKWFTGVVAFPIGLWWYVFLVLYPQSYRSYRLQEMEQRLNQNGARPEGGLDE